MPNNAAIPNPFLQPMSPLIGRWKTTGTHPLTSGIVLHGEVRFEWIEGGAYVRMSAEVDDPRFPDGIAIFGSDDEAKRLFMLYVDERGVSRKYNARISAHELHWWRNHPGFSQRATIAIAANGRTMVSTGELCQDGVSWKSDLSLTYTRIE